MLTSYVGNLYGVVMDASFAPYAPPENVLRVLERVHKNGLRGKLDATFLGQLGISENLVPRILRALEFLGLIAEDGDATPLLNQYIQSSEADGKALLMEALHKSYEPIFRAVDPEKDGRERVHTAFKIMRPQGQWTRMVTFFLAMCQASGMSLPEPPKDRPGKSETTKERKDRKVAKRDKAVTAVAAATPTFSPTPTPTYTSRTLDPALVGIMGKVVDIDSTDDLDAWIDAFRATFCFVKKISPVAK